MDQPSHHVHAWGYEVSEATQPSTARFGYIGLGQMGSAMAGRLLSTGATVTVCDLDAQAMAALVEQGATAASSPAELAQVCDIISICVPADAHIRQVLTGATGVQHGCSAGQTILIHSTVSPQTITWAHDTAAAWGVDLFDACVAGGGDAAKVGELVILAGGVSEMSQPVIDALNTYGSLVIDGGPVGSGAALKIGVNTMTYAQFAAASSAFEMVKTNGGNPQALMKAWRHTGQLGKLTESFTGLLGIPPAHIRGAFRESLLNTVSIATKDLELAEELMNNTDPRHAMITSLRESMTAVFGLEENNQ